MQELAVPSRVEVSASATLCDAVAANAADHPDAVVFSRRAGDAWVPVTAKDFAAQVRGLAAGLVARGVQAGDRVALLSRTRYEWTLADYAIWTAGAVTVPVYETSSAEQVAWILSDSAAVSVVVETAAHEAVVEGLRADLPALSSVVQIDAGGLDALAAEGAAVAHGEIDARRAATGADSLATLIYTSGTTGRPKGCELTHRNLLFDVATSVDGLSELFTGDASTLLFLPLAHVFARVVQVGCVQERVRLGHTADVSDLVADLGAFQPTFILAVPRIFEKVYNSARTRAHADSPVKKRLFDAADATAVAYSRALDSGRPGPLLSARRRLFDRLVYSRLRAAMGGRISWAISGGAPLGPRLGHFFRGAGLPVLEGYGLTETTAGATVNTPHAQRVGTVGRPLAGSTVRIGEDREVQLRGPQVFRGYWHNPEATAAALDGDGFFHTGDLGELDAEGYLRITGRSKEMLVTAAGKNVSPAVLEDRLNAHPLVDHSIVVGDGRSFIACLVTLDADALPAWAQAHGRPAGATARDLADDPELRTEIQQAVDTANQAVSRAESIRAFRILPGSFTEAGGELTPTLKLKRSVVMRECAEDVAALYADSAR